jgi:hypothetical protein
MAALHDMPTAATWQSWEMSQRLLGSREKLKK